MFFTPDGFAGRKPEQWTHWVLAMLGYDPHIDEVADLFAKAVIADAAALTPGRVSQVVSAGEWPASTEAAHDRWHAIRDWPGDALRRHRSSFSGRMTFPPYGRRRS
ncbi:hypothetical protein [Curtobacterium sp. VKM Ac-2887]|uniref:hypothetical protein n=1 Tax=Curtobacterium sp. VKM Ac-2887 TaxID=2783819 RepID=UPI00188BC37F|nr:hypothetical protein [Curtobacterium sp. VKM Ac-2887]